MAGSVFYVMREVVVSIIMISCYENRPTDILRLLILQGETPLTENLSEKNRNKLFFSPGETTNYAVLADVIKTIAYD